MKALSLKQIVLCETSKKQRCRCRCHGALHGVRQGEFVQTTMFHLIKEQQHEARQERVA